MSYTLLDQLKDKFSGLMASADESEKTRNHYAAVRRKVRAPVTDGGTAATAVTETPIHSCGSVCGAKVRGASVIFPVAVTASGSVHADFTVSKRTAGGSKKTLATITTNTSDPTLGSNAAAFVEYAMALTSTTADLILAAGDTIQVEVSKASTGTAIASATAQATVIVDLEETAI